MLSPWRNTTVTVQRRGTGLPRDALNEPNYGNESTWPTVYTGLAVRIEYVDEAMEWVQSGERVVPKQLDMYVEPDTIIQSEDRVTITGSDASPIVGALYIVTSVYPEWDGIGSVHHYVAELDVH
jgi:hypothetical protein